MTLNLRLFQKVKLCPLNFSQFVKWFTVFLLLGIAWPTKINAASPLSADRWLEIDLYFFDHKDMEASVTKFWDRYFPLVEGIEGWRGVIMNVGWTSDYILEWHGDANEAISLPKNMKKQPWFKDEGQLSGSTIERIQLWQDRFSKAEAPEVINYETWTYSDLKKLSNLIRTVAQKKYRLADIKVGTLVLGMESLYHGEPTVFSKYHPNAFLTPYMPNMVARFSADSRKYGAYPNGMPEGTPFTEFFGKQWGNLSRTIGLDVIILRDCYLGVGLAERNGPYGRIAPPDPEKIKEWSRATADLVKQTKISNPKALVIGYSNDASAIGDWRVNCFDLEALAKEGYLDGWIEQSWAGAFNEVGQRSGPDGFWNYPIVGWTYQLGFILGHAAVLADTKVHHYFLTETYDAWESFDIIHNSRERLRWGIWAYSHAAVKKPGGLKMPAGSYISWCNKGKELLSEEDVKFLAETSNDAIRDAKETKKVLGPTLVYCRSAMEWKSIHKPNETIGEWIDEQAGTLMKWSVPIQSITRSEYLPEVESDMFIFQTPVNLNDSEKRNISNLLKSGKPAAVFACPAGGMDKEISEILGVSTTDTIITDIKYIGTIQYKTEGIYHQLPNTFPIFQPFTENRFSKGIETIYSVAGSPCLGYNKFGGKNLIFWNAPEFSHTFPGNDSRNYGESIDQILGSPTPFVLTARLINELMKNNGSINTESIEQYQPLTVSMWQLNDGSYKVLAANTEEGINHTSDLSVHTTINFPVSEKKSNSIQVIELWNGAKTIVGNNKLKINLEQAQSKLFSFR